jgi:RNA polymerase sigma-70 factor, ECF subfamily
MTELKGAHVPNGMITSNAGGDRVRARPIHGGLERPASFPSTAIPGTIHSDQMQTDRRYAGFDEFFGAWFTRLAQAMYVLTGSQAAAQDLAQDAFVRLLDHWTRVSASPDAKPAGYVFTVAYNAYRRQSRRAARLEGLQRLVRPLLRPEPDPAGESEFQSEAQRLLSRLPVNQRAALVLVGFLDASYQDAAQLLGVPVPTVKTWVHRARSALKTEMEPSDG